jgi:hypothetical protein
MTQVFTCTSDASYDRHTYEIVLKNGKNKFFEHWEDAQGYWFEHSQIPYFLDLILVKDKKVSKEKIKAKGFV